MRDSIAAQTQHYIAQHPYLKECIKRGLVNYSALAREVCGTLGVPVTKAVVVAASRYARRLSKQRSHERQLESVLRRAKLTIRGRMLVAGVRRDEDRRRITALHSAIRDAGDHLTVVEGLEMVSLATDSSHKALIRSTFRGRVHTLLDNVAQVALASSTQAMFMPGLSGYVLSRIASFGVNVIEEYTCAGEHLFIVQESDLPKVLQALQVSRVNREQG